LYIHNGEILFTPKKKILFPNEIEYFKFIYNGPRDDKERYYKININELPMLTYEFNSNKKIINFSPSISLDTYLIVKPAIINFDYFYDGLILKNRGNTYFRVIMDTSCSKQNNPHYFYLLPNQEYSGELLKNNGNKYIIYNEKYILIDKKC
ncbi:fimbrial protein, partial [Proteus mirabilis]